MSDVVVVGGGPGGVLLTYLLARGGASVTLLESRHDFARRFRGDTLAPGVLEYLDSLGLAEPLLAEVPHARSDAFRWHAEGRTWTLVDYRGASRRFPFYALISQARFLPWLAERARDYGATVRMGARFSGLRGEGRVTGVDYTVDATTHAMDAALVVGADGRNSKVRASAGIAATELGASLDILWHALPRHPEDPDYSGLDLFGTPTGSIALLDQGADWQLGWTIRAGTLAEVRARGVGALIDAAVGALPWLAGRLDLDDVTQLTLLPVRITTVERWTSPGVVLLGDAAHVVSPVGGNGINLALADAADLANRLIGPLRRTPPDPHQLDVAAAGLESARRAGVEREQRAQARTERAAAARIESGDAGPPTVLRGLTRIPGFPYLAGRRARVEVPAPVDVIAAG